MKKLAVVIFFYFGRILGYILTQKVVSWFVRIKYQVHSGFVSVYFKKAGTLFYCEYPLTIKGSKYIEIGDRFSSFKGLRIEAYDEHNGVEFKPQILIGNNVSFNFDCHIACVNKISIGNNVLIASKVFITDHFHGKTDEESLNVAPNDRKLYSKGAVIIEDNVWIGEGVAILPNVVIGKNSVIGANSVVNKSFPENSVIGGNPAKLIKRIAE